MRGSWSTATSRRRREEGREGARRGVSGAEGERLRRAVERLLDGQREALEVIRRALDEGAAPAEDALGDLEDILEGSLEDARAVLGMDEEDEGDEA